MADYDVSNLFSQTPKVQTVPVVSKETSVASVLPAENVAVPTPADKRKVRVMKADINAKLRGNDANGAYAVYEELKEWVTQKGFTEWDDDLSKLSETMGSMKRKVKEAPENRDKLSSVLKPVSDIPKKAPVVDLKKIQREFHRETADIKALARTGRKDDARIALHKLETRLHRDDLKEFDAALTDIRKQYGLENAGAVKKKRTQPKRKSLKQRCCFKRDYLRKQSEFSQRRVILRWLRLVLN